MDAKNSHLKADTLLRFGAIFVSSLYVIGFIIVNTYLSRFNYFDFGFSNPRFIAVGGVFFIYSVIWWITIGNHMLLKFDTSAIFNQSVVDRDTNGTPYLFWLIFLFDKYAVDIICRLLICAFAAYFILMEIQGEIVIYGFVICTTYYIFGIFLEKDRTAPKLLYIFLKIAAIASATYVFDEKFKSFWKLCEFGFSFTMVFVATSTYFGLSIDNERNSLMERFFHVIYSSQHNKNLMIFHILNICFLTIRFGHEIFVSINTAYGGAIPRIVEIERKSGDWRKNIQLIYMNDKFTLIKSDDDNIVIQTDDILSMKILKEPNTRGEIRTNICSEFGAFAEKVPWCHQSDQHTGGAQK